MAQKIVVNVGGMGQHIMFTQNYLNISENSVNKDF